MHVTVEQWGRFEAEFSGPSAGNPFVDVEFSAEFSNGQERVRVTGFYDGDGVYRVRFMPSVLGAWSYVTESNVDALNGHSGTFTSVPPSAGRYGARYLCSRRGTTGTGSSPATTLISFAT